MYCLKPLSRIAVILSLALAASVAAQEQILGKNLDALLDYARAKSPEYAAMQAEADAFGERITPAGALPDPRFRAELRDITRMGEQGATFSPSRVGSTRYLLMQDLPWFGKRDLKREIAEQEAEGARGRALGTWADIAGRIKVLHAQRFFVEGSERLTREILDLLNRLEKIAQARYASGLVTQQEVIRAQVEQSGMQNELIALEIERQRLNARLNALLARPAAAPVAPPEQLRSLPAAAKLDFALLEERVRSRNPQLFAEEAKIRAAEKTRALTYRNRYPDFTLGISPIQYQSAIKEWEVMFEVNIPLQQDSRRAQERESEAMLSAARARRDATANQLLGELAEGLAAIEAARQAELLLSTRLLPQAELAFKSALAAYENGKVDFATLLDAQRQTRQARQNQLKAQVESQLRLAEIERLLGEEI